MINNAKDLGKAMKDDKDNIEIEFDFGKKVLKIVGTGKIVWGVVAASLAVTITAILVTGASGGTTAPATGTAAAFAATSASAILGPSVAYTAVGIAISGGGMIALTKLRRYEIIDRKDRFILKKKR